MEAGEAAELAVEAEVPALGLEVGIGIAVRPWPSHSRRSGRRGRRRSHNRRPAGGRSAWSSISIVDVELDAVDGDAVVIVAIFVAADVAVAPEAEARGRRRLAGLGEDFVGALVPQVGGEARNDQRVERRCGRRRRSGRSRRRSCTRLKSTSGVSPVTVPRTKALAVAVSGVDDQHAVEVDQAAAEEVGVDRGRAAGRAVDHQQVGRGRRRSRSAGSTRPNRRSRC